VNISIKNQEPGYQDPKKDQVPRRIQEEKNQRNTNNNFNGCQNSEAIENFYFLYSFFES
jgi:hypothetical protein